MVCNLDPDLRLSGILEAECSATYASTAPRRVVMHGENETGKKFQLCAEDGLGDISYNWKVQVKMTIRVFLRDLPANQWS